MTVDIWTVLGFFGCLFVAFMLGRVYQEWKDQPPPMTDLNQAGIEKAANQIHMMLAVNFQHAQSIARAAITAYLECAGEPVSGDLLHYKIRAARAERIAEDRQSRIDEMEIEIECNNDLIRKLEADAKVIMGSNAGLTNDILAMRSAPTPETREPSEGSPVKDSLTPSNHPEIPESWMLAEINRLREALQGIVDCAMSGSLFEELALDALENRGIDHQSALAAAPKAPSAEGWRTMESAPKDGQFLACTRAGNQFIARWGAGAECWLTQNGAGFHTHFVWMPLPAPPMKGEKP